MSQNLSQRLKKLREQHGYSQEGLASELFVSRQAISQWENGKSSPDVDKLIALAQLYDVSMDELLLLEKKNDPSSITESTNTEEKRSPSHLEQLYLAVVLLLSIQLPFLPLPVVIFIALWMKKNNRHYILVFLLCIFVFLFGCYNTFGFISHFLPNYGTPSIKEIQANIFLFFKG